ncbi:hypothetical protein Tco_0788097 [Tanacetum coccineum]
MRIRRRTPEEDHTDYLADGRGGDDEPSDDDDDDDDDDTDDEDEDDDEEEEEHLALVDSFAIPIVYPVPSTGDTEAFETNESVPTPRSPQTKVPFAQTCLRRARKIHCKRTFMRRQRAEMMVLLKNMLLKIFDIKNYVAVPLGKDKYKLVDSQEQKQHI